ncbi:hypothetical protein C8F01DRAFT_1248056 [Mycena amicta]|nr:hypothetical protein C8F01DRAFT_1248056 [Mycena amicta]
MRFAVLTVLVAFIASAAAGAASPNLKARQDCYPSYCDCNEDGCTASSPNCCANGSCPC